MISKLIDMLIENLGRGGDGWVVNCTIFLLGVSYTLIIFHYLQTQWIVAYILPFAFALTPPRCYFSQYEIIYNNNLKTCEVLTLLLSIIFLKNGRDLHSPCVLVISGASFSKEKNLRKVVGYPLSKSCNFSVAHSLCVFDRAWLLEISESSGLDERGAPSSIICPFLF